MQDLKEAINQLANGQSLSREDTKAAFNIIMSGEATDAQIGAVLMAMRVRGETEDEFAGAIDAMRAVMLPVDAPDGAIDIVGTGGDAKGSYNISTCTSIVTAACGVKVAKHGNRSLSSKSGASDCLTALGVNIELSPSQISDCIEDAGIGFMFAPAHHSAVRHVGPARVELATRTIFNLLGPMCNPASVKRQLLGVFAPQELNNGTVTTFEINPSDFGFDIASESDIAGGDATENAKALREVLDGKPSAYRNMVIMNTACSLVVADKATDLSDGAAQATAAIDNGAAMATLEKLILVSNQGNA